MIFIYLVGCHFVGVLRIRFLLGFVSGTLPTRTRPRFENTYGFPREFTPENNKKSFVKLKGVLRIIASKFYEVLRQIQDSRLNRSRVFHFTILSLHKDHWPLPPEIAKFYFTSLAKKRLMIYSINRFPHVRFRYFFSFSFLLNQ